jgi:arginine exporter protein ArgO
MQSGSTLLDAAIAGLLAGYGIAIPVGAIAVLIIETAARHGGRIGAAAGLGAASVDGIYAAIAVLFGAGLAAVVAPVATPLRWVSVAVLVAIAAVGLRRALRDGADPLGRGGPPEPADLRATAPRAGRTYAGFLGLTLLNPMTVVYFGALVLGLPALRGGIAERLVFAAAAFVASASWQLLLAAIGALLHRHATRGAIRATSVAGNLIILGFAARIAAGLLSA